MTAARSAVGDAGGTSKPVIVFSAKRRRQAQAAERAFGWIVRLAAAAAILSIVLIFVFVTREALPLLWQTPGAGHEGDAVTWSNLVGPTQYPDRPSRYVWQPVSMIAKYNLAPLVTGTLKTTLVAILLAAPLAILAAIPSVVLGFFALMVLATWLQDLLGVRYRLNALTAGVGLGLAVIPIIYTVAEDALAAVPRSYREASYALGANRWETALRIVVPAALPGIFAGVALGFGRAVGETMIVLMASGNAALTSWSITDSVRTLSATIAAELGEVVFGGPHYRVLFLLGVLLFVFTFAVNLAGELTVRRLKRTLGGRS